jgi:eukaryotic-like serine/threonine-protein kinase
MGWLSSKKPKQTNANKTVSRPQTIVGRLVLGRYEILQQIGEGSNGEVYQARDVQFPDQYVVVKRVKSHVSQAPRFQQFFLSEVQSMTRFHHPYVVKLLNASLDDPIGPCFVLEYVHGLTLEALFTQHPRWYAQRLGPILGRLCHALQAAQDAGIIHRDLKPANIMITDFNRPNESLKVMDFGFAGFLERPHIQLSDLKHDADIQALGTPAYISPEMVRGQTVDHRADIYAVGVMLYEALTGRLPFDHPTVSQIIDAHANLPVPRFSRINIDDVSREVEAVVQCALSKFPSERHFCARELARHFGQAIGTDIWSETLPASDTTVTMNQPTITMNLAEKTLVDTPTPGSQEDLFTFFDTFQANLSPKLAAIKVKAFIEEVNGMVLDSQPGIIKMNVGLPAGWSGKSTRSGVLGLLNAIRNNGVKRGHEPIEIHLEMVNIKSDQVQVCISFHPMRDFMPNDLPTWQDRCDHIYNILRMFLMAQ